MFSKAVPINLVKNKRMALGRVMERIARPKAIFEYVWLFTAYNITTYSKRAPISVKVVLEIGARLHKY